MNKNIGDMTESELKDFIVELQEENSRYERINQKYKEVIDKVKKIIFQPNIEIREYRSCDMDYVYINEQLLEILNEVNK